MVGRGLGTGSTVPLAGARGESLEGPPPCPAEAAATHVAATTVQLSFCRLVLHLRARRKWSTSCGWAACPQVAADTSSTVAQGDRGVNGRN